MSRIANKDLVVSLIFLCSLIQTLTLTPPPNNALLAILDMYKVHKKQNTYLVWEIQQAGQELVHLGE